MSERICKWCQSPEREIKAEIEKRELDIPAFVRGDSGCPCGLCQLVISRRRNTTATPGAAQTVPARVRVIRRHGVDRRDE